MKNSFILSEIRNDLARRLLLPIFVVAAALLVLHFSPRDNIFKQRPLNYKSQYENFYNRLLPCVHVEAEDLRYTGFDCISGGTVKGHYYYTLVDGFCQFYLLGKEAGAPIQSVINTLNIHGRLIELDKEQYESLLDAIAEHLGWKSSSLRQITAPYAVSSLTFSFYLNLAGRLAVNLCLLIGLADLFCSLIFLAFPLASPAFRYLKNAKEARKRIFQVEQALPSSVSLISGRLYLSASCLLYLDGTKTRLIPLKEIIWTDVETSKGLRGKNKIFLCLLASDGKLLKFPCSSQEKARKLVSEIRSASPEILTVDRPKRGWHWNT